MATITIDGQEYDIESLSDNAKAQVTNIQACDQQLSGLNIQLSIYQTARNGYAQALAALLPAAADESVQQGVIAIDGVNYELSQFSDQAKAELVSIQAADKKLSELRSDVAMVQTARNTYSQALVQQVTAH